MENKRRYIVNNYNNDSQVQIFVEMTDSQHDILDWFIDELSLDVEFLDINSDIDWKRIP